MENDEEQLGGQDQAYRLAVKAQELGDVELAILLCLITHEHCIIEAEAHQLNKVEQELVSISNNKFGLASVVLTCSNVTSVDDFGAGVLVEDDTLGFLPREHIDRAASRSTGISDAARVRVADVVIVRDLHLASPQVQIQTLELIRNKRVYTRTDIYTAPKQFLLIALVTAQAGPRFIPHLNDQFLLSHIYDVETDDSADLYKDDNSSTGSIVRSPSSTPGFPRRASYLSYVKPTISKLDIDAWITLTSKVKLSPDVRAHLHNIVVFTRMHRAVASGVTPQATRHIYALSYALAPLHGLDFITPSLVALAVRKVYPHRLTIVKPEDEMSLQWGSSLQAVTDYLEDLTVEDIIEDVLGSVETPL